MNKIILKGNLSTEPENKTNDTTAIARFNIAVNRKYTKQGEEKKTDFFGITVFGKLAETVINYLHKGNQIVLEGRIENNNYQDKDGNMQYHNAIIMESFDFCGKKDENTSPINTNSNVSAEKLTQAKVEFQQINDDELPF